MKSARLLLKHMKEGDTILDVGCFTQEAAKYFPRTMTYIGIDGEKYHKNTKVVDLNHGFEAIACNGVLCLEVLEHLVDPEDCLEAICSSVSQEGRVVLSLPNEATLFHRIRSLLGTVDGNCFSGQGKHLHLPSLKQSRTLCMKYFDVLEEKYYISPSACGSQAPFLLKVLLALIPDRIQERLSAWIPSLFARGFIFVCKKKDKTQDKPGASSVESTADIKQ